MRPPDIFVPRVTELGGWRFAIGRAGFRAPWPIDGILLRVAMLGVVPLRDLLRGPWSRRVRRPAPPAAPAE